MLSDEEKQAIEYLKRHIIPYYGRKGTIEFMLNDIVLNLIEKQQKEIEELKEDRKKYAEEYIHNNPWLYKQLDENYILRTEADKLYNKKWKDKIKAKIEEIIKEGNYRTADNPNGRIHFQKEITDYQIEVLQSLLEKE